MGLVTVLTTIVCRPPPISVHAASFVSGVVGRTITGVTVYAAAQSSSNNKSSPKTTTVASMIGNMASSMFGKSMIPSKKNPKLDEQMEALDIPSWKEIRSKLEEQQTPDERLFRNNLQYGYGVASPFHKIRLYDESKYTVDDIRVTFYRDSASWCPYCQKVWMTLEEKQIPYRIEKVNMRCYGNKPLSFQQLQPSGQIPVAIIDNVTYRQSNDILSVLEESFPNHKSLLPSPEQPNAQSKSQYLLRLERQLFSAWMNWLTSSANGKEAFVRVLEQVEQELQQQSSGGPFFLGNDISMVDIQFAPFLERIVASMIYYKGYQIRVAPNAPTPYPAINAWFDAMEQLPSYRVTKGDYYSHNWDLPPQLGGCVMEPAGRIYERVINGETRLNDESGCLGSWELPLQPHNGGIEPDWVWTDDDTSRREVVERLSFNYEAIVKFAARGAGTKGFPPVSAPLADPNATPNEAVQTVVSLVLRLICLSLLDGSSPTEKYDTTMDTICRVMVSSTPNDDYISGVINSLSYLRDRVGVPRDMELGAARQFRAHLNWSIKKMLAAQAAS